MSPRNGCQTPPSPVTRVQPRLESERLAANPYRQTKWSNSVRNPNFSVELLTLLTGLISSCARPKDERAYRENGRSPSQDARWGEGLVRIRRGRPQPNRRCHPPRVYGPAPRTCRLHHGYAPRRHSSPQSKFADLQSDVRVDPTPRPPDIIPYDTQHREYSHPRKGFPSSEKRQQGFLLVPPILL